MRGDGYSDAETAMADRFIATGQTQPLLRSAKVVFLGRYYSGYDSIRFGG